MTVRSTGRQPHHTLTRATHSRNCSAHTDTHVKLRACAKKASCVAGVLLRGQCQDNPASDPRPYQRIRLVHNLMSASRDFGLSWMGGALMAPASMDMALECMLGRMYRNEGPRASPSGVMFSKRVAQVFVFPVLALTVSRSLSLSNQSWRPPREMTSPRSWVHSWVKRQCVSGKQTSTPRGCLSSTWQWQ